jgi:hypothetical protein
MKMLERHDMERADRNKALGDISDTRRRLGGAANPSPYDGTGRQPLPGEQKAKKDARARYQFDATGSDDELEDELDENLDETLEVTRRLKNLATAMGDEVSGQNSRLTRVTDKTENLEVSAIDFFAGTSWLTMMSVRSRSNNRQIEQDQVRALLRPPVEGYET